MNTKSKYKLRGTILCCVGGFFLLFGIPFMLVGSILGAVFNNPDKTMTAITSGVINDVTGKSGSDSDYSGYAVVTFSVNGKDYQVTSKYSSSTFRKGDTVDVEYSPANPAKAFVKVPDVLNIMFNAFKYGGIAFVVIALILVGFAIWQFVSAKKHTDNFTGMNYPQ